MIAFLSHLIVLLKNASGQERPSFFDKRPSQNVKRPGILVFMVSWSERSNYDRIYVPFNLFLFFRQPNYDRIYDSCIYFICFRQPNYGCISM